MRKPLLSSLVALLLIVAGPAFADPTYVTLAQLDLTMLLAPPPGLQSEEQQHDLAELLAIQKIRTPAQEQRALADATAGTFGFADVLGPKFNGAALPKTAGFFEKVRGDGAAAFNAGKDVWSRPRPFDTSSEIHAVGTLPKSSSYPSGNSTAGYLTAIVLANMVPEKSAALHARGREFGDNRMILGVHYRSDVEAGRLAAVAVAASLFQNPAFLKDFAEAKAELRPALGL